MKRPRRAYWVAAELDSSRLGILVPFPHPMKSTAGPLLLCGAKRPKTDQFPFLGGVKPNLVPMGKSIHSAVATRWCLYPFGDLAFPRLVAAIKSLNLRKQGLIKWNPNQLAGHPE